MRQTHARVKTQGVEKEVTLKKQRCWQILFAQKKDFLFCYSPNPQIWKEKKDRKKKTFLFFRLKIGGSLGMWIAREKEEEEEVKIDVSMHSLRSRGKRGRNLPFLLLDSFFPPSSFCRSA